MFLKVSTAIISIISIGFGLTQLLSQPNEHLISVVLILIGISQIIIAFFSKNKFLTKLSGINSFVATLLLIYLVISKLFV
jgi:choline-glycine betaine transporter